MLPWPSTDDGKRDQSYVRVGDRVHLQHTVREDWCMHGTVIALGPRRSWIEVRPDQPITSPANWVAS